MIHEIKVNIKEIVEYSFTRDEQKQLIDFITFDCMTKEDRKSYLSKFLNDLLETENEFDRRSNLIKAFNTVIKAIE